jgi:flagellar biosynthesis protein
MDKAVALEYDKIAPKVIATARGILVKKMLEIAKQKNITVYKDHDLTELLSVFKAGDVVPERLFGAVSVVMAYCYRVNSDFREKLINSGMING